MVVRRLPGGSDLGTPTGSNSSAPASGQSTSYQSTGTPSTTTSLTSTPSAQATGTASPSSASSSIASTVTSTSSQVPTASPTPVTTQTSDLSASPTPTNVPEQITITASTEGVTESAPLPSSSLTEFSEPISSAPLPDASAAQQSPEQTSEFTGTIITAVCCEFPLPMPEATGPNCTECADRPESLSRVLHHSFCDYRCRLHIAEKKTPGSGPSDK
ncbi:hypothetical protein PGT21_002938 [Puccinia graminis f. sp. tritici]|uniref:Uncharacterized protein n=1 Tax=Puccinia graminis f. sp. tritici TaxID=56615 RepID=A0A5B0MMT2_PUCGR|nr:hypothetical protein PGT21_002938 [Puccinia graminis f. sp. tritici]